MLRNPLILISIVLIFFSTSSFAEKTHGIAMHGKPKYEEGFTHLDYVNPDAPKGGTVRFGAYGAFDNLNRVAFKGSKAAGLGYINDTLMRRVWDEAFTLYGLIAEYADMPDDRSLSLIHISEPTRPY